MNNASIPNSVKLIRTDPIRTVPASLKLLARVGNSVFFISAITDLKNPKSLLGVDTMFFNIFFILFNIVRLLYQLINPEPRGLEPLQTVLETAVLPLTPWL